MPQSFSRRRNLLADDQPLGPEEDMRRGLADDVIGWASPMKARDPDEAHEGRNAGVLDAVANGAVEAQREEMLSKTVSARTVRAKLAVWPVEGSRTLNAADKPREGDPHFGTRRTAGTHGGVDIEAPVGTPVLAAGAGRVVRVRKVPKDDKSEAYGNQVVIDMGGSVHTQYAHLQDSSITVAVGDEIRAGQMIGKVGLSGNSPGDPHLHFEIRLERPEARSQKRGTVLVDALEYLPDHDRVGRSKSRVEVINPPVSRQPY